MICNKCGCETVVKAGLKADGATQRYQCTSCKSYDMVEDWG